MTHIHFIFLGAILNVHLAGKFDANMCVKMFGFLFDLVTIAREDDDDVCDVCVFVCFYLCVQVVFFRSDNNGNGNILSLNHTHFTYEYVRECEHFTLKHIVPKEMYAALMECEKYAENRLYGHLLLEYMFKYCMNLVYYESSSMKNVKLIKKTILKLI